MVFSICSLASMSRNLVQIFNQGCSFPSESNLKCLCPTQCISCSLMRVLMSLGSRRFYSYWECVLIMHQSMQALALPRQGHSVYARGIFRYLTSKKAAGIGNFDLFCTSSKNSGGVDRGIFHLGRLGKESLVRQDGGFWH